MAQAKRKTPAKKSGTKNKKQSYVKDNVYAALLFCLSLLLLLSIVTDLTGTVGRFFKSLLFGLFGPGAFVIPVFLIYIGVMLIKTNKKLVSRGVFGIIFILVFSSFYNLIVYAVPEMGEMSFAEYLNTLTVSLYTEGSESLASGGVLGGYISVPLSAVLDKVGAGIIIFAVMLVTFIVATGINLKELFTSDGHRVKEEYPEIEKERKLTEKQLDKIAKNREKTEKEMTRRLDEIKAKADRLEAEERSGPADETGVSERRGKWKLFGTPKESESGEALNQYVVVFRGPGGGVGGAARKSRPDLFEEKSEKELGFTPEEIKDPGFDESIFNIPEETEKIEETADIFENPIEELKKIAANLPEEEEFSDISEAEEKPEADEAAETPEEKPYVFPPVDLLNFTPSAESKSAYDELKQNAEKLIETLRSFNIEARVINVSRGPTVTRYELQPSTGVRVSKITNLSDDIALQLAAVGVRIEAPIPGKSAIGIEVPNKINTTVYLRELIDSDEFRNSKSNLSVSLGKDITGGNVVCDLAKMPHLLIAGATGSGKSVCVNSMLISLLYHSSPDDVKLILVDPKVVELNVYNGLPHLLIPVVTEAKKAAGALGWAVSEMLKRYEKFKERNVRDFQGYNNSLSEEEQSEKLPQIVIVIDEMADLMMTAPHEVEDAVCRLAQMARAAGMHLVIATQRPSADVITGTIKANVPSRIAFAVSSAINSRIILDESGAEKLVGKGDMLFMPIGAQKPTRIQGCFVSDGEVEKVIAFIKENSVAVEYSDDINRAIEEAAENMDNKGKASNHPEEYAEEASDEAVIRKAIEVVVNDGRASTSLLQRRLSLGYARAARVMDELYNRGIIGPYQGSKPREVLMSKQQYLEMLNNGE